MFFHHQCFDQIYFHKIELFEICTTFRRILDVLYEVFAARIESNDGDAKYTGVRLIENIFDEL